MERTIKIQDLYDSVMKYMGADKYNSIRDDLPDKLTFLLEHIVLRDKLSFGTQRKTMVSEQEAVIIRELFIKAILGEKPFGDWFHGKIKENDYSRIVELCDKVDELLYNLAQKDYCELSIKWKRLKIKVENKTCARWSEAIKASLNYDTAFFMVKAQVSLDEFCSSILPLKHSVRIGEESEYFSELEPSIRKALLKGYFKELDFEKMAISKMLTRCYTQDDYINLIIKVIKCITADAQRKSVHDILAYVNGKKEKGWKKVSDAVGTEMLASDELKRFQNMYQFLKNNPKLLSDIEEKTGESNLLEFFHVEKEHNK